MRNVLLVSEPSLAAPLRAHYAQWVADRQSEGWTAAVHVAQPAGSVALRAELLPLLRGVDHVFLVGALASVWWYGSNDGHPQRKVLGDGFLVCSAAIDPSYMASNDPEVLASWYQIPLDVATGRLMMEGLSNTDPAFAGDPTGEAIARYKAYFAKRHAYTLRGSQDEPLKFTLLDHLQYLTYVEFGQATAPQFAAYPTLFQWINPAIDAAGSDEYLDSLEKNLIFIALSGGANAGLYYTGWGADFLKKPLPTVFCGLFGSMIVNAEQQDGALRSVLADPDCLASVLAAGWGFVFRWEVLLSGKTIGQAGIASNAACGYPYTFVFGDPTMQIDTNALQNLQAIQVANQAIQAVNAMDLRVSKLETQATSAGQTNNGQPSGSSTNPGPGASGLATLLAMNCGGGAQGSLAADTGFTGGSPWSTASAINTTGVANALPASVYQTCRTGRSFGYALAFKKPDGSADANRAVTCRMHFCEPDPSRAGTRLTNASINGAGVLFNFDPATVAGGNFRAVTKDFAVTTDANGLLTLAFSSVNSYPLVCAIEILG